MFQVKGKDSVKAFNFRANFQKWKMENWVLQISEATGVETFIFRKPEKSKLGTIWA